MATNIDLNRVATFVRVVEAGSFTRAAAALGLPTSSVSRAVAHLEDTLGVRLLHRTTRRLSLTESGQRYFDRMEKVIAEAHEATQAVAGPEDAPRGLVRITAPVDLGVRELPTMLTALSRRHPGLSIDVNLTSRQVDLIESGIDLAIRGGRLEDSALVARRIGGTELGIFASPGYLKAHPAPIRLAEIARHRCVLYRSGGKATATWRLTGPRGEEAVTATGPISADDMLFVLEAVVAGAGLGLLPVTSSLQGELAARRLQRVLPRHAIHGGGLYLVWPSRRLIPARVALVRDYLITELTRLVMATL